MTDEAPAAAAPAPKVILILNEKILRILIFKSSFFVESIDFRQISWLFIRVWFYEFLIVQPSNYVPILKFKLNSQVNCIKKVH